jgi:transposase InsO family protein
VFSQVGEAKIFSTLDLLSGFWQVPMTSKAQKYTAFSVGSRHFEFCKMPFGLRGAPGTFVQLMQKVLDGLSNVVVYGDDVLIFSKDTNEHTEHVRSVLRRFQEAGLVVNGKKCQFSKREVTFLGHRVSAGQTSPVPEKVECIREFHLPSSKKSLQSFLGLAGFYRRFIPSFATVLSPLYDLLKGGVRWSWGDKEETAFEEIKRRLCDQPVVLRLPIQGVEFEISTDASDLGLGAILSQDGQVVEYASRRLNDAERNYSTTEKELLAIVWAVEKWRQYLFAHSFTVITDHRPITYLKTMKEPKGRVARWVARLQEYEINIRYRRGADNQVADCLSRPEPLNLGTSLILDHEAIPPAWETVSAVLFHPDPKALATEQRMDPELRSVIEGIQSKEVLNSSTPVNRRYRQIWKQLSISQDGVLIRRSVHGRTTVSVPVIPASQRQQVIQESHGSAHMGVDRTYDMLRANAYWPGLQSDVQKFVTTCKRCQLFKPSTYGSKAPLQPIVTSRPMQMWAVDLMGPLPCTASNKKYILVATDLFSKWVETVALENQTAATVARALVEVVVLRHGPPQALLSDQGTNFESMLMKEVCELLGVNKLRTTPFHPRTDGQTERINRTLKEWISAAGGDWEKELPFATYSLNTSANAATQLSPFEVVFGRRPPLIGVCQESRKQQSPHEYVIQLNKNLRRLAIRAEENSKKNKKLMADRYNATNCQRGWLPYEVGIKVKYRNHYPEANNRKFSQRFRGPFVVVQRKGTSYKIQDESQRAKWVHHDELRPWKEREEDVDGCASDQRQAGISERAEPGHRTEIRVEMDSDSESEINEDSGQPSGSPTQPPMRILPPRNRRPPEWFWQDSQNI